MYFFLLVCSCLIVVQPAFSANEKAVIEKATKLLNTGQAKSAYEILEKYEDEYAGWWEFDYLYGVSALESGNANLAIFSLHRVIAMKPDFIGAHIDLGRAYFNVNEFDNAKNEFNYILRNNPNKTAEKVSRKYLSLIENRQHMGNSIFGFYAEVIGGYDTNSNSATSASSYKGFVLDQNSRRTPSPYFQLKFGNQMAIKINESKNFNIAASITQRKNTKADHIDYLTTNIGMGLQIQKAENRHNFGFSFSKTNVDEAIKPKTIASGVDPESNWSDLVSNITTFSYNLGRALSKSNQLSAFSSVSYLSYRNDLSNLNALQLVAGSAITISKPKSIISMTNLSAYLGKSLATHRDGDNKNLAGVRASGYLKQIPLIRVRPGLSTGVSYSQFSGKTFDIKRRDGVIDVTASLSRTFDKSWHISTNLAYIKSNSTVNLYDFSRLNGYVGIKRAF